MSLEVFLERVPGEYIDIMRCSICKAEFHSSPVGPRMHLPVFPEHVRMTHPDAVFTSDDPADVVARLVRKSDR